jgi:hypothetical protein
LGRACGGRRRPRPGPRAASSQLDPCDGAGRGRSMLAFRTVQQSNRCAREDFSTNSRPALRAAGGQPEGQAPRLVERRRRTRANHQRPSTQFPAMRPEWCPLRRTSAGGAVL